MEESDIENLVCSPGKDIGLEIELCHKILSILEEERIDRSVGFFAILSSLLTYSGIIGMVEKEFELHMEALVDVYKPSWSDYKTDCYESRRNFDIDCEDSLA